MHKYAINICYFLLCAVVIFAMVQRCPNLTRDLDGWHGQDWQTILNHQMAISMLTETHNPFIGYSCYTQPEFTHGKLHYIKAYPVNWLLAGVYSIFPPSIKTLRTTLVLLNILSIVLFFLVTKGFLGPWCALLGSFFFSFSPLCAYFSGHAIPENFLYMGQLLFIVTAYSLLSNPFSFLRLVPFQLTCLFLVLVKPSTGMLIAASGFIGVHIALIFLYYNKIKDFVLNKKFKAFGIGLLFLPYFGLPIYSIVIFNKMVYSTHGRALEFLATADYYRLMYERLYYYIGPHLFIFAAIGITFYLFTIIKGVLLRRKVSLNLFEKLSIGLFFMNLFQHLCQVQGFRPHVYYSLTWAIPFVLITISIIHRAWKNSRKVMFPILAVTLGLVFIRYIPLQLKALENMMKSEGLKANDRNTLKQFFSRRKNPGKRYFIITREPRYAYFADTKMLMHYDWNTVLRSLTSKDAKKIFEQYNIQYLVCPLYQIPPEVKESLKSSPLIDPGPNSLKLGLVHTGDIFYIFKYTQGISGLRKIDYASLEGNNSLWNVFGNAFSEDKTQGKEVVLQSKGAAVGHLFSIAIKVHGDAILFKMKGSGKGQRVELIHYGDIVYKQYPKSNNEFLLTAIDVGKFWNSDIALHVVDSYSMENFQIGISSIEEIYYKPAW